MTTTAAPISAPPQHVVLRDVSWETYERLLRDLDGQHLRLTYDRGTLEIMSPSVEHANIGKLIARMVEALTFERNIPLVGLSNATWRSQPLDRGLEAAECYYLRHAHWAAGRSKIDLSTDPPPELAIEVDISSSSLDKQAIYAALGVRELWRYENDLLTILLLDGTRYRIAEQSECLPLLTPEVVRRFVHLRVTGATDTDITRAFVDWLRQQPA